MSKLAIFFNNWLFSDFYTLANFFVFDFTPHVGREQNVPEGLNRISSKFEDERVSVLGFRAPRLQNTEQFPIAFYVFKYFDRLCRPAFVSSTSAQTEVSLPPLWDSVISIYLGTLSTNVNQFLLQFAIPRVCCLQFIHV